MKQFITLGIYFGIYTCDWFDQPTVYIMIPIAYIKLNLYTSSVCEISFIGLFYYSNIFAS